MALVPIPSTTSVAAAAGNVAHKLLYGGLADLRPMPRTLIDEGILREVYHYRPLAGVEQIGDPILLVTPLAAPSSCFDLRRGCSLVEHLLQQGRPVYLVEYGEVSFRNRTLGMEHWVEEVVPLAVEAVARHAGGDNIHVAAWSLGGIFALLASADRQDLPIGTISIYGSPIDVSEVPLIAPLRPLIDLTGGRIVSSVTDLLGGAPKPFVRWAFQLSAAQKMVTKPVAQLNHLADADYLAQLEAVDRFTENMIAYPGRAFGQLYHRFVRRNELVGGTWELDDRVIRLSAITQPVLVFAGATDGIAPIPSVRAVVPLLEGSPEVYFEIVPGGHLGMLTGRSARTSSWLIMDEFMAAHDGIQRTKRQRPAGAKVESIEKLPSTRAGGPRKVAAKKAVAKKPVAKKPAAPKAVTGEKAIGSNPNRRYNSANSRALGQARGTAQHG